MPWEYTSVSCDTWLPVNVQGGVKELLKRLGADGWEAAGRRRRSRPEQLRHPAQTGDRVTRSLCLADALADAKGGPIDFDGRWVTMSYVFEPIRLETDFELELRTASERPQGVHLRARSGDLVVDGEVLDDVLLWSDTAPPLVPIRAVPAGVAPMSLRLWNVWRGSMGVTHSRTGDAGLSAEVVGDGRIVIAASDGFSPPSFDDLRVVIHQRAARRG
jgi:hypothetical protein